MSTITARRNIIYHVSIIIILFTFLAFGNSSDYSRQLKSRGGRKGGGRKGSPSNRRSSNFRRALQFTYRGKGKGGGGDGDGGGGENGAGNNVTCDTRWSWDGRCQEFPDTDLGGLTPAVFCNDLSPVSAAPIPMCDLYNGVIREVIRSIINFFMPIVGSCSGEFTGEEIKNEIIIKDHGCDKLPLVDELTYGMLTARYEGVVWGDSYSCIATIPNCENRLFAWAANTTMVNDILQLSVLAANPAVEVIRAIVEFAAVPEFAFGIAEERGGFEVPLELFTKNGFVDNILLPNFFVDVTRANRLLPAQVNNILPTTTTGRAYWGGGDSLMNIFSGNLTNLDQFSGAIVREINTQLDLGNLFNLVGVPLLSFFPEFDIANGREISLLVNDAMTVPVTPSASTRQFRQRGEEEEVLVEPLAPGYYSTIRTTSPLIQQTVTTICGFFSGLNVLNCTEGIERDVTRMEVGWYREFESGNFSFGMNFVNVLQLECISTGGGMGMDCEAQPGGLFSIQPNTNNRNFIDVSVWDEDGEMDEGESFSIDSAIYQRYNDFSERSVTMFKLIDRSRTQLVDEEMLETFLGGGGG